MINRNPKRKIETNVNNQIAQSDEKNAIDDEPQIKAINDLEYRIRFSKNKTRLALACVTAGALIILEGFLCWKSCDLMRRFDNVLELYQSSHDIGIVVLYGVMSFSLILAIVSVAIGMLNVYSTRKSKKANTTDLIKALKAIRLPK